MNEENIPYRQVRKSPDEIKATLDRLDNQAGQLKLAKGRRSDRYAYRVRSLKVEIPQIGGTSVFHSVPSRNISREGLSLLVGNFVYPKTHCKVHLVSVHNHTISVGGVVVRCRYLEGSACLYEVGVQFDQPIDIELFHRGATRVRLLLADDDEAMHHLVARLLKSLNVELTCVEDGRQAVDQALAKPFDLILMDVDMPILDGLKAVKELRDRGYTRPIVILTASDGPGERETCLQTGASGWLAKPLTREALTTMVISMKDDPIVSSLVHVTEMADLIDQFVGDLSERVTELENAFRAAEWPMLERLARALKGDAGAYGFEVITHAAAELEQMTAQKVDLAALRAKLTALGRLCLAARPVSGIART